MKKQIRGKLYDTGTARILGHFDIGDTHYELYRKRTGEWFTYQCSIPYPWANDFKVITPVTLEEVSKLVLHM